MVSFFLEVFEIIGKKITIFPLQFVQFDIYIYINKFIYRYIYKYIYMYIYIHI